MLEIEVQKDKACDAPERFVQEARVDRQQRIDAAVGYILGHIGRCRVAYHSPRLVGIRAEALLIEEVAPASYRLPYEEARCSHIEHRRKAQLFELCDISADKYRSDYSSVDSESAVTEIEELGYRCRVAENDIVKPCSDYCAEKSADDCICCSVGVDACFFHSLEAVDKCEHYTQSDKKTVPVDLEICSRDRKHYSVNVDTRSESVVSVSEIREKHSFGILLEFFPCCCRTVSQCLCELHHFTFFLSVPIYCFELCLCCCALRSEYRLSYPRTPLR